MSDIKKYLKNIRRWVYILKNDPEALKKVRMLVMLLLICVSALYAGFTLFVEPLEKRYAKKKTEYDTIYSGTSPEIKNLLLNTFMELQNQEKELNQKIEIARLQNTILKEKWQAVAGQQIFARVILSLLPSSPKIGGQGMLKLDQLARQERDDYTVYPVMLEGESSYSELYDYLSYLESRNEVGLLDTFKLQAKNMDDIEHVEKVVFSMRIGRVQIEETL